jgi:Uncharacterized protein involved in formation of periplasmic nitrate reductase
MSEDRLHIVSSAVVLVRPGEAEAVARALAGLPLTEVAASAGNKIVVVLEGASRGEVGARLTTIALMDGVVGANMVFEHAESDGEDPG